MSEARAELNNYRQSPRKVRLVAGLVKGKRIEDALTLLSFIPKRVALPMKKLLSSALANSEEKKDLVVKKITVDAGPTLFRRRPRSRGMANPIHKRTSHVSVVLSKANAKNLKHRT